MVVGRTIDEQIVGICEASLGPHGATIDTVAVHPDRQRMGLGSALVEELVRRLQQGEVRQLDAWTRDDPGILAWYQACGFEIRYRYLHVFAEGEAEMNTAATVSPGLIPRSGFFHAGHPRPSGGGRPAPAVQPGSCVSSVRQGPLNVGPLTDRYERGPRHERAIVREC
jgi:hypothetical protein